MSYQRRGLGETPGNGYAPVNMSRGYAVDAEGAPIITYTQPVINYYNSVLTDPDKWKYSLGPTPTSKPTLTFTGAGPVPGATGANGSGAYVVAAGAARPAEVAQVAASPASTLWNPAALLSPLSPAAGSGLLSFIGSIPTWALVGAAVLGAWWVAKQ